MLYLKSLPLLYGGDENPWSGPGSLPVYRDSIIRRIKVKLKKEDALLKCYLYLVNSLRSYYIILFPEIKVMIL